MKRICMVCLVCALFLGSTVLPFSYNVEAHVDQDSCGLARNYNTDNTMETSIRTDQGDDTIQKAFYIGTSEFNNADRVYLWVYAKCWGTKNENSAVTHKIYIHKSNADTYVRSFQCFKSFSYDKFQWQMFEFSKDAFEANHWVLVEIEDFEWDWTINNLEFGIDTTYGACAESPTIQNALIKDWDQSYWYSGGAGVTPNQENEIIGELMIKLEFVRKQKEIKSIPIDFDTDYNLPYSFITLDDSHSLQEKARWRIFANELTQNDIDASSYARLYIYGYSWIGGDDPNPPMTQNHFIVTINNNQYDWDPDIHFAQTRPIGHWYYFDFIPSGNLIAGSINTFQFQDTSSDYVRHNLAIIKFSDLDDQRSAWYYDPGTGWVGDPNLNYLNCQGEMGIYLFLFKKFEPSKIVGGISLWCEDHDNNDCPYTNSHDENEHGQAASKIADKLEAQYNWMDKMHRLDDTSESPYSMKEGYFTSEFYNNEYTSDACDLVIFGGHGEGFGGMFLTDHDFVGHLWGQSYGKSTTKDIFTNINGYQYTGTGIMGKPETDAWDYMNNSFTAWSEDGFNFNTDWILLLSCSVLRGMTADEDHIMDMDNPMQLMLYHGAHILMGYATDFIGTQAEINNYVNELVSQWCTSNSKIIDGFIYATTEKLDRDNNNNRYMIYYHSGNFDDYLWDENTVTLDYDFQYGYEDRNILGVHDTLEE